MALTSPMFFREPLGQFLQIVQGTFLVSLGRQTRLSLRKELAVTSCHIKPDF